MHIVYLIKIHRPQLPNRYIGSKSNVEIREGQMFTRRGLYIGSASDPKYSEAVRICGYTLQILGKFDSYGEALKSEHDIHIANDVVANPVYFNRSFAISENNFTDPSFATYRHVETGKVARLPRMHRAVKEGKWVGLTKGRTHLPEHKAKIGRSGESNPFFGKTHSKKTIKKLAKTAKKTFTGKPKTYEQRRKMSEARKLYWANRRKNREGGQTEGI
jgi:hypothetical protein